MESIIKYHRKPRILSKNEMDELLSTSKVGRLGLSDNNNPYVVPVTYWYDEGKIYFHSPNGKKIQYIKKNPQVCFEVDLLREDGSWKSVIVYGKVTVANDTETIRNVFQKVLESEWPPSKMAAMHLEMGGQETKRAEIDMYVGWIDIIEMTGRKGD
ncbi:MAG: pyridoxamine 5'-phosphate oxidase family protein [Candidatus Methylarchaceae archaeon HK02M2]|nr:pyridoxamine 5'-phosphate oxidase family protein [Candidatus Methylarchaceae archaeon HK02M2]